MTKQSATLRKSWEKGFGERSRWRLGAKVSRTSHWHTENNLTFIDLVSIGISHNILLARLATRQAKPAGLFHLLPHHIASHLAPLKITAIHGVGRSIRDKIQEKFEVETLGDLLDKNKEVLKKLLGEKTGDKIWKAVRGIDDTQLESDKPRKSVSAEVNVSSLSHIMD